MPDTKQNLHIFEAVNLRKEYDSHIRLLQNLLTDETGSRGGFLSDRNNDNKQPADGFKEQEFEDKLKKLQTKRLKLNQEIQTANFNVKINFEGDLISIAEALETRKGITLDIERAETKTTKSAYCTVIHKEERDIVEKPRHSFTKSYNEYCDTIKRLRKIEGLIHTANHSNTVNFKDE